MSLPSYKRIAEEDEADGGVEDLQETTKKAQEKLREIQSGMAGLTTKENSVEDDVYTVADALDHVGVGKFHYKLLVVVSIISLAGGLGSTGFALFPPLARCHLGLESVHEAFLTSAPLIGAAIGGVAMGYLATEYGRRTELLIMMVWTSFFGFLSAASPTYWWLIILRILVGFGHGGTGQRLSILFEYIPTKHRTLSAGVLTFCWNIGNFLEAVLIKFFLPSGVAWRLILIADATVFAIGLCFHKWLPESCYFLMTHDRKQEAIQLLEKVAEENGKKLPPGRLVTESQKERYYWAKGSRIPGTKPPVRKAKGSLLDLFRPANMCLTTILLSIAWFTLSIAVVGCAILTEELLQMKQTLGSECRSHFEMLHGNVCEQLGSADYTPILLIFASEFPALFLTYFSADILGRRKALALSYVLSGFFFGLLIICPVSIGWTTFFLGGCRMSVTTAFSLMIIYTPEVYPTSVRGMAVGASRALYRTGSAGVPFVSQVLLRKSVVGSKAVHSSITVMTGIICLLLPIETNNRQLGE